MSARLILVLALLLAGCNSAPPKEEASNEPVKQYALHGVIQNLDSKDKIAKIKHQKIGDWMEAMTMEFPVKDQKEFDSLRTGEPINATVYVQGNSFWVGNIHEDTSTPAENK